MFYSPLKNIVFRNVWLVMFFSNIGTWIHTVTSSIYITKLTSSTILITMVQVAGMIPIFLFSVAAGVLADLYDKKIIVVAAQAIMAIAAFAMALIAFFTTMSPSNLIAMTFLLNVGYAFNQPAWQASSSLLVPPSEIKQSAALNNLSFNVSRCIGPAIAGYFFSTLGPSFLYFINGISFLLAIFVLQNSLAKKEHSTKLTLTQFAAEFFAVFYIYRQYSKIKPIFLKAFLYFVFASSIWALLPYIIITCSKMPEKYLGLITGMAGLGAVINAYGIYYLRMKFSDDQLTTLALFLASLVMLSIIQFKGLAELSLLMLVFGYSWSIAVSVFNGILQSEFPIETRSRIIGIYYVIFAGSQALGGYSSGYLVHRLGLFNGLLIISLLILAASLYYLLIPFFNKYSFNKANL